MKFSPSTEQDTEQLSEWIKADIDLPHRNVSPSWWLTGNGVLSYCLQDFKGPTMYVRLDKDKDMMRLHCQFAPVSEVSRMRVARSLLFALPRMREIAKKNNLKGFVYTSTNSDLICFMQTCFGFIPFGNDDYHLMFEVA
jgi:hypothetical protein